jgi:hypothetical protein
MVCAEHTIGSEVIFDAPKELLGDVAHVKSRFGPVWRQCQCRYKIGAWFTPNVP